MGVAYPAITNSYPARKQLRYLSIDMFAYNFNGFEVASAITRPSFPTAL